MVAKSESKQPKTDKPNPVVILSVDLVVHNSERAKEEAMIDKIQVIGMVETIIG